MSKSCWIGLLVGVMLAPAVVSAAQPPPAPTILIAGGTVVDGTGAKRFRADVRITGDTITEIGTLPPKAGERVIAAKGLIVAPGFIDAHSHADGGLLEDPDAETQIRQGITTAIVGQDGGSHFPLKTYFETLLAKHAALNIASFVGHGTVRGIVLGQDFKRVATSDESAKMADIVDAEMQEGALGLSSGLEYVPGRYSDTDELIACARAAAKQNGMYISHVRNEDNQVFEAFAELIQIGTLAHIPVQISHIKLGAASVWGEAKDVLELLQSAYRGGLQITADVYPYRYWQSTIVVLIPTENWDDRAAWEKGLKDVGGAENVLLSTYSPDLKWQGKTIAQIAILTGKDAVTVIQEIVRTTHGKDAKGTESVVVTAMNEKDVRLFIRSPRIMYCSDGSLHGTHPRGAGTFPRILGEYVRETRALPLEEAVRKMTSLPAKTFQLPGRGVLKVGAKADITLFNAEKVADTATAAQPTSAPLGIPTVLVNGVVVLEDGKPTGAHPGIPLRRGVKN